MSRVVLTISFTCVAEGVTKVVIWGGAVVKLSAGKENREGERRRVSEGVLGSRFWEDCIGAKLNSV